MEEYNVYCDESCHLQNDNCQYMLIGCVYCKKSKIKEINDRIKRIKETWKRSKVQEIKWTKISKSNYEVAKALILTFFDDEDLHFRAIIVDKTKLNFKKYKQHDFKSFYYVAYYEMLKAIISPNSKYNIYLDMKDTNSQQRVEHLKEVLDKLVNWEYNKTFIEKVQQVKSHEIQLLQITDLLLGAISYSLRNLSAVEAKTKLIEIIKKMSGYDLTKTTLLREEKFNLLFLESAEERYGI